MGKNKSKKPFDPANMSPQEQLKFEIAQELGLDKKVLEQGWRSLTAKESGRIGGIMKRNGSLRQRRLRREIRKVERWKRVGYTDNIRKHSPGQREACRPQECRLRHAGV